LQHGQHIEIGFGHNVGHIPMHKHLPRSQADDLVGWHPAVRTTDPQVLGPLLTGELLEKLGIVRADGRRPLAVFEQQVFEVFHDRT